MLFILIAECFGAQLDSALEENASLLLPLLSPGPADGHSRPRGSQTGSPMLPTPHMPGFGELSSTGLRKSSFPGITDGQGKLYSTLSVLTCLPVHGAHLAASGWWAAFLGDHGVSWPCRPRPERIFSPESSHSASLKSKMSQSANAGAWDWKYTSCT